MVSFFCAQNVIFCKAEERKSDAIFIQCPIKRKFAKEDVNLLRGRNTAYGGSQTAGTREITGFAGMETFLTHMKMLGKAKEGALWFRFFFGCIAVARCVSYHCPDGQ